MERIPVEDALLVGEATLDTPAEDLARMVSLPALESALAAPFMGFGDIEFYPDFHTKAAVLCSRIVRNHPLPDGNKRLAYMTMVEFIERNGRSWDASDQDAIADTIEALAAREISEMAFAQWVDTRVT
jgi:death-on-curing protein